MIWESLLDGSYGDNSGTIISYTPTTPTKAENESTDSSPRILLGKYLRGKLNQNPSESVLPKSEIVCEMLNDIILFAKWESLPPVIECKKYSTKKVYDLQELLVDKCRIKISKEHLPQTGYQVEYFLELFKYIKGVYETS